MDLGAILASDQTLHAAEMAVESEQADVGRGHLGASEIGKDCVRSIWYSFVDASPVCFEASTLFMFEDGHITEDTIVRRLAKVCDIDPVDPVTGKQWRFSDIGGHFAGSADGIINRGLVEAPATPHLFEAKCLGESTYKKLVKLKAEKPEKEVLAAFNMTYYAQGQVYMHYFKLKRHYLVAASAGGRMWTSVRTEYDPDIARFYIDRAERIIGSKTPPPRIAKDSSDFRCRFCNHSDVCFKNEPMGVNCRTCQHSYAGDEGTWVCELHSKVLARDEQLMACGDHVYVQDRTA